MLAVLRLNNIKSCRRTKLRVGRGHGSNGGKSGRGSDGQKARESIRSEGGQFPSYLRIKKRGFVHMRDKQYYPITLRDLYTIALKEPKIQHFDTKDIRSMLKIPLKYKLKIIGYNLYDEQMAAIEKLTFNVNLATASVKKLKFISVIDEKKNDNNNS